MVQWIKDGLFGVIEQKDKEHFLYVNMTGDLEETSQLSISMEGDTYVVPVVEGKAKGMLPVSTPGEKMQLSARSADGSLHEIKMTVNGQTKEGQTIELDVDVVSELAGVNIPQVYLSSTLPLDVGVEKVTFQTFRKIETNEAGSILVESDSHESTASGAIVFEGLEAAFGQKEHRVYEFGTEQGVNQVLVFYRLNYLTGALLLKDEQFDEIGGARYAETGGADVRGMLQAFPYEWAGDLPKEVWISSESGVLGMASFDGIALGKLLLDMRDPSEFTTEAVGYNMTDIDFGDEIKQRELNIEGGGVVLKEIFYVDAKDITKEAPKLVRYKSEGAYHFIVSGQGEKAAIVIVGSEETVHFDIRAMTEGKAHFIVKSDKVNQGQTVIATANVDGVWGADRVAVVTDTSPVFPIKPTVVSIDKTPRSAQVSFEYPSDPRYAFARLYSGTQVAQDEIMGSIVTIGGLDPLETYTFGLVFVDEEGFESESTEVSFTTDEEIAEVGSTLNKLTIDNILVTYKI
ncbi:hypothetical protein ACQR3P_29370 [Rhodococcus sp. IEGM1300]